MLRYLGYKMLLIFELGKADDSPEFAPPSMCFAHRLPPLSHKALKAQIETDYCKV